MPMIEIKRTIVTTIISKIYKTINVLLTRQVDIECDHIPHKFSHVPIKKIWNWIFVEISVFFKPEKPWGLPTHLQIEPTSFNTVAIIDINQANFIGNVNEARCLSQQELAQSRVTPLDLNNVCFRNKTGYTSQIKTKTLTKIRKVQ